MTTAIETIKKSNAVGSGYAIAKRYADAGLCVLPIRDDGTKRPDLRLMGCAGWKNYQSQHPTEQQLKIWFANCKGYGVVCGKNSGGLEVIDFDDGNLFCPWSEIVKDSAPELYESLVVERTPRGGYHILYCCDEIESNQPLAQKSLPEKRKIKTLIETRGEGGFIVISPTAAKYHTSGRPYELIQGNLTGIPIITKEERSLLLDTARTWNEKIRVEAEPQTFETKTQPGDRPGDKFATVTSWAQILEPHSWNLVRSDGEIRFWKRPGKQGDGHSATTGFNGNDILYVFSSNAAPFKADTGYSKFAAYSWLNHNGNYEQAAAQLAKQQDTEDRKTLPQLYADDPDLAALTERAWEAIKNANKPEQLFLQGGICVRLEQNHLGDIHIRELTADRLRYQTAKHIYWFVTVKDKQGNAQRIRTRPPMTVIKNMLAADNPPLPVLTRVVETPIFDADGNLQTEPGYHKKTATYYAPPRGLKIPPVPAKPTQTDIESSKRIICDELLVDFPFVGQDENGNSADRANAIGLMLQPAVREMIEGPTPMHACDSTAVGSGKGLLLIVLLYPSLGRRVCICPMPKSEEEIRKVITSNLRDGTGAVMFDNVSRVLNSGMLSAVLTADVWRDRILGKNETCTLPVKCIWTVTGNNLTVSTEIARRVVRIRLDPKCERPWERIGFKHPNLKQWVSAHRAELIHAILTLVQNWVSKGKPLGKTILGSFENWAAITGGIIEVNGFPNFLGNLQDFYETADTENAILHELVSRWWEAYNDASIRIKDLFKLVQPDSESTEEGVDGLDLGTGKEHSRITRLGKYIAAQRDKVVGDYCIKAAGSSGNAKKWKLVCGNPNNVNINTENS